MFNFVVVPFQRADVGSSNLIVLCFRVKVSIIIIIIIMYIVIFNDFTL